MTGRGRCIDAYKYLGLFILSLCLIGQTAESVAGTHAPFGRLFSLPSEREKLNKLRQESKKGPAYTANKRGSTTQQANKPSLSEVVQNNDAFEENLTDEGVMEGDDD